MQKVEIEISPQLAIRLDEIGNDHNLDDLADIIVAEIVHSVAKRDREENRRYRE